VATPTTIINQVKWQVDRARGGRLVAADMLPVVVRLYRELWDIIINACPARFVTTGPAALTFTLTGGSSSNSYPIAETNFYRLYEGERSAVQKRHADGLNWLDVPEHRRESPRISYRFEGDTIFIEPPDDCAGVYRFRYVYKPADLTTVSSVLVDFNGWVEAGIVHLLTLMVRSREEESESIIAGHHVEFIKRVQGYAAMRQSPARVIDVKSRRRRSDWDDLG
jgi:hypothetical protein